MAIYFNLTWLEQQALDLTCFCQYAEIPDYNKYSAWLLNNNARYTEEFEILERD